CARGRTYGNYLDYW
nr:immunoglobulin heavy chain junction region [Mus musculus]MBK4186255.1 immunoglobulin heavy chain junction region [Mus musculus]